MKSEFLVNRTLQMSLGERRACHPPPSPIARCGLHQEYEGGSGEESGIQKKKREEEECGDEGEEREK